MEPLSTTKQCPFAFRKQWAGPFQPKPFYCATAIGYCFSLFSCQSSRSHSRSVRPNGASSLINIQQPHINSEVPHSIVSKGWAQFDISHEWRKKKFDPEIPIKALWSIRRNRRYRNHSKPWLRWRRNFLTKWDSENPNWGHSLSCPTRRKPLLRHDAQHPLNRKLPVIEIT